MSDDKKREQFKFLKNQMEEDIQVGEALTNGIHF